MKSPTKNPMTSGAGALVLLASAAVLWQGIQAGTDLMGLLQQMIPALAGAGLLATQDGKL